MIYFVEAVGVGHLKIGFTEKDDAEARVSDLQTGSPVPLRLLGTMPGTLETEKDLHRRFAAHRILGAGVEWFKPVPELLALIPAVEPLRCEGAEVVERSVQIRVLTVGRKQFSKALLAQLPFDADFFDLYPLDENLWGDQEPEHLWDLIRHHLVTGLPPQQASAVLPYLKPNPGIDYWGWTWGDNHPKYGRRQSLIFERQGRLHRYSSFFRPNDPPANQELRGHPQLRAAAEMLWGRTIEHWLADHFQLFIGI